MFKRIAKITFVSGCFFIMPRNVYYRQKSYFNPKLFKEVLFKNPAYCGRMAGLDKNNLNVVPFFMYVSRFFQSIFCTGEICGMF